MNAKRIFIAVPAALLVLGSGMAHADQTIDEAGALACVNDKWDEKEPDKGHKLVDYAGRCVTIPDDPAATPMATDDCVGNYEHKPDGSWKGTGTCNVTFKGGDKISETWEEGSHLKEYTFKYTGKDDRYEGVMAQDVLKVMPEAVSVGEDGYYRVDYAMLGIELRYLGKKAS